MKRFLHEIRRECPAFDCEIVPKDLLKSYFVKTYKTSDRIKRQDGMFMIFGLFDKNKDKNPANKKVIEICTIKKNDRKKVKKELKRVGLIEKKIYLEFNYEYNEGFYE